MYIHPDYAGLPFPEKLPGEKPDPGNVELDSLSPEQRSIYDRRLREAMPGEVEDPGFWEKLGEMWQENKTIRDTFYPKQWRDKNSGGYPAIGYKTKLRCACGSQLLGSHRRGLQLPQSHGVFFSGCAAANEKDCVAGDEENIRYFGVCSSVFHPLYTQSPLFAGIVNMLNGNEKIILQSEGDQTQNVKGYKCIPMIVGDWMNPFDGLRIASNSGYSPGIDAAQRENFPVVTYESFLVCMFGGIIEPAEYPSDQEIETESGS